MSILDGFRWAIGIGLGRAALSIAFLAAFLATGWIWVTIQDVRNKRNQRNKTP